MTPERGLPQVVGNAHGHLVFPRRVERLAAEVGKHVAPGSDVIDLGCGDGSIGARIAAERPGVTIRGYEVLVRPDVKIPVQAFDGVHVPEPDDAADVVILVDVLHHTEDPRVLLAEAARVARTHVIVKDHRMARFDAGPMLRFMDWVGNRAHGVVLPYNYWSEAQWREAWSDLGLAVEAWDTRLRIYPWPVRWLFDRGLHFVAKLAVTE